MTIDHRVWRLFAIVAALAASAGAASAEGLNPKQIRARYDVIRRMVWTEVTPPFPYRARRLGVGGAVALRCRVTPKGEMADCKVAAEKPAGYEFGKYALPMARYWALKPKTPGDLVPPDTYLTIHFRFHADLGHVSNHYPGDVAALVTPVEGAPRNRRRVMPCPAADRPERQCEAHPLEWAARPGYDLIEEITGRSDQKRGVSLLECSAGDDGGLTRCKVGGDATDATEAALLELARHFKAPAKARDGTPVGAGRILVEVDWDILGAG